MWTWVLDKICMPVRLPKSNFFILLVNSIFKDSPKCELTKIICGNAFLGSPPSRAFTNSRTEAYLHPHFLCILEKFELNVCKNNMIHYAPHFTKLSSLNVPIRFCEPVCTRMTQQCGDTCCILASHSNKDGSYIQGADSLSYWLWEPGIILSAPRVGGMILNEINVFYYNH